MINIYRNVCSGCRACEKKCPINAITMVEDEKGFLYPQVDEKKCIKCGICRKICPTKNEEIPIEKKAYAAYNNDEKIRLDSSSGGIFDILANYIIEKNGVVFGAAFDKDFNVKHIAVDNKKDICKLRKSKYVQSDTNSTFEIAKKILNEGRMVYFSGTPCQIEGLKAYLDKDYDKLITQDLICHGVPSPKVWREYLKNKSNNIQEINFRSKEKSSWDDYQLKIVYNNKEEYENHDQNAFMKLFLNDLILRDSCYNCKFKKENRVSDFTLADFWGIDRINKEMNDHKGISLLIVNSAKAKKILEEIKDRIIIKEVEFEDAIKGNKSINTSANKSEMVDYITELIKDEKFYKIFEEEF